MNTEKHRKALEVVRRQAGHATRAQLVAAGISTSTIGRWLDAGVLVPAGARTVRLASTPASLRGHVIARALDVDAVVSHRTGVWMHEPDLLPPPRWIDLSVEKGRSVRGGSVDRTGGPPCRIHTTTNLAVDDVVVIDGIRVMSVARSLMGLAAEVPSGLAPSRLVEIVSVAVERDLASEAWLWWILEQRRCRGRNGVKAFEAALAERSRLGPTESWLEREVLKILRQAGLPLPVTQRVVRRSGRFAARVDFLYEAERIVLEALGYGYHRTPEQSEADTRRANELQLLGYDVFQFTTRQVTGSPASVVASVRQALAASRRAA